MKVHGRIHKWQPMSSKFWKIIDATFLVKTATRRSIPGAAIFSFSVNFHMIECET